MKPALTLITALFLAPLAGFAQAKPEIANATKAAKRAWESAPDEKKALWQQQREALKHIDLSEDTKRQIVIARGSPVAGEYHAHPTTAMLADNKTVFCVWNIGHGGHAGPMARSDDAGLTWTRMDDALPPNYANFKNCPSIYRLTDPQGKERVWVFAARTLTDKENPKLIEGRHQGFMPRIVSEDDGRTWRELPPIGGRIAKNDPFRCIMTFSSIVRLNDGSSLGLFHRGSGIGEEGTLQVPPSVTRDGGFTWSEPVLACDGPTLDGKHPCESYAFRSPDGDEGQTWSRAVAPPWSPTGAAITVSPCPMAASSSSSATLRRSPGTRAASSPGSAPTTRSSKTSPANFVSVCGKPSKTGLPRHPPSAGRDEPRRKMIS